MVLNLVYRLKKWLVQRWAPQFEPKIPQDLQLLGEGFGLDLVYVRYTGRVLSVSQVDEMLDSFLPLKSAEGNAQPRMFIKNRLMQYGLMSQGGVGVDLPFELRHGYRVNGPEKGNKLWKKGRSLIRTSTRKKEKEWKYEWLIWKGRIRKVYARIFDHKAK